MTNNPLTPYGEYRVQEIISTLEDFRSEIGYNAEFSKTLEIAIDCVRYLAAINKPEPPKRKHPCVNCSDGWGMQTSVGFDSCHFYCSKLAKFEEDNVHAC